MEVKSDRPLSISTRLDQVAADQVRANQERLFLARTELQRYREAMAEKQRAERSELRAAQLQHAKRRKAQARQDAAADGADRLELSEAGKALADASGADVEVDFARLQQIERELADGTLFDPARLERAARRLLGD
jgi:hypothetical protein